MGQPAGAPDRLHPKAGHPKRGITALCLVGLVASTHAGTHQIEGRIVGVHDVDTITLLDVDSGLMPSQCHRGTGGKKEVAHKRIGAYTYPHTYTAASAGVAKCKRQSATSG